MMLVSTDVIQAPLPKKSSPQLTISDLFEVKKQLRNLGKQDIINLGLALGLLYPHLDIMDNKLNDMVSAWLNREDNVKFPPSWAVLIQALRDISHTGIADDIEREKTSFGRLE